MLNKKEAHTKFLSISSDLEAELDEVLSHRKGDIEKELEQQIQRLREEADDKIAMYTEEINREKTALREYATFMAELEEESTELKHSIDSHIKKVAKYRKEIWGLLESMDDEFKAVSELEKGYEKIQNEAFQKASLMKTHLEEKYGIKSVVPENHVFSEKLKVDVAHENEKIQKAKVLMGPLDVSEAEESAGGLEQPA